MLVLSVPSWRLQKLRKKYCLFFGLERIRRLRKTSDPNYSNSDPQHWWFQFRFNLNENTSQWWWRGFVVMGLLLGILSGRNTSNFPKAISATKQMKPVLLVHVIRQFFRSWSRSSWIHFVLMYGIEHLLCRFGSVSYCLSNWHKFVL